MPIDLRSDTVTQPTPAMRAAMAEAEVGDDVYGEDPTVRRLQEKAAGLFGMEAALYCPSGVMCNQVWLQVLARPGTEVVVEADAHVVNYEAGAAGALGGVQFRTVAGRHGLLDADDVTAAIRPPGYPLTPTSLVCVENTHNRRGGAYYTPEQLQRVADVCHAAGVPLYMDGARVFHAAVAAGAGLADYGAPVDALMCSLSKALSAPVGSVMVGSRAAIDEALTWRRRYGGAMRQAGVLAAAGLVALEEMTERLADDHANARLLADAAADAHPAGVDVDGVVTNIVLIDTADAPAVVAALRDEGVLANAMDPTTVRLVTHPGVTEDDCRRAAQSLRRVLSGAQTR